MSKIKKCPGCGEEYYMKIHPEIRDSKELMKQGKCPACGYSISPDAVECPDCGLPFIEGN